MNPRSLETDKLISTTELRLPFTEIYDSPYRLSNELVRTIGQQYLKKFAVPKDFIGKLFSPHRNHALAEQLTQCNLATAYERWIFLGNVIEKTPSVQDALIQTIFNIHDCAFNERLDLVISAGSTHDAAANPVSMLSSSEVAIQFQIAVNKYFDTHVNHIIASEKKYIGDGIRSKPPIFDTTELNKINLPTFI